MYVVVTVNLPAFLHLLYYPEGHIRLHCIFPNKKFGTYIVYLDSILQ